MEKETVKKWRAKYGYIYYYIDNVFEMKSNTYINSLANYDYENMVERVKKMHTKNNLIADSKKSKLSLSEIDNKMYEALNYFKTKAEAKEYAEYIKKCSLEWHESRGRK